MKAFTKTRYTIALATNSDCTTFRTMRKSDRMGILKVECVLNGDVVKLEMPDDGDVWTCIRMYHPNIYDMLESGDIIGVTVEG